MNLVDNEFELIRAISSEDENAFKRLVETFQDYIFRLTYSFIKQTEDAEDITQEVFIEIYHSAKNFRQESKISTWIYKIAVNKSINYIKKKKR